MATALFSATIMERLLPMITFLFVFVVVYGFSKKTGFFGIFGDKDSSTGLAAIIAVLIAFIAILSKTFTIIVGLLVPWFMIITIAIFFILFVLKMFGLKDESMVNAVTKDATIRGWLIGIFITLVVIGMVISFGNDLLASTAITDGQTTGATTVGGESGSSSSGSSTHFDPDRKAELTATTSVATNIANTLTHPKVLGFIILFIIAFLAVFYLAAEP
ncbi:MAG: hypothetical protein H6502_03755 [Candidatus Woesearchaeota archaeon]|nr:MAG: hypothetical protein H6502_03755 [Candidatus Woesearchaeota archaeon]